METAKRHPGRRLILVMVGLIAGLLLFEGLLRAAESTIPSRLDWPTRTAQAKADLLADGMEPFPQVVFVGSSVVDSALDPHLFTELDSCERTAFNAGIDDASPQALEAWIADGILSSGNPKTVVIGMTSRALRRGRNGGAYRHSRAARNGWLADAERWFADTLEMVEARPVLQDPERWPGLAPADDDGLDEEGWHGHNELPPPYRPGPDQTSPLLRDYEPNPDELAVLAIIVETLRARGIDVVLADMAVSEDWQDKHPDGADDVEAYRTALAKFAEVHEVPLIDLTNGGDTSLFIDPLHVNGLGAERATNSLVGAMSADCA